MQEMRWSELKLEGTTAKHTLYIAVVLEIFVAVTFCVFALMQKNSLYLLGGFVFVLICCIKMGRNMLLDPGVAAVSIGEDGVLWSKGLSDFVDILDYANVRSVRYEKSVFSRTLLIFPKDDHLAEKEISREQKRRAKANKVKYGTSFIIEENDMAKLGLASKHFADMCTAIEHNILLARLQRSNDKTTFSQLRKKGTATTLMALGDASEVTSEGIATVCRGEVLFFPWEYLVKVWSLSEVEKDSVEIAILAEFDGGNFVISNETDRFYNKLIERLCTVDGFDISTYYKYHKREETKSIICYVR